MNSYDIKDLQLAGISWEITDVPAALRAKWNASSQSPETQKRVNGNISQNTTVVPPIAPNETISIETVISMAMRPSNTDNLIRLIKEFNHPLRGAATNVVLPNIAKNPNGLIIVSDVPGIDDDESGCVLSGAAGELLDKMLAAIGMGRDTVSIIPIVFWRTPGGRTPTTEELSLARPFVDRLLEFLKPRVILTLGATPATEIAGIKLTGAHGAINQTANGTPVMSIYHPNYLLLKPSAKRDVWTALQELQNLLKNQ